MTKEFCIHNHPLNEENIYRYSRLGKITEVCKLCRQLSRGRYISRQRKEEYFDPEVSIGRSDQFKNGDHLETSFWERVARRLELIKIGGVLSISFKSTSHPAYSINRAIKHLNLPLKVGVRIYNLGPAADGSHRDAVILIRRYR